MAGSEKKVERAGLGKHVIVELVSHAETERLEFDIVPDEYSDFENGFLGAGTPLAKILTGLPAGGNRPYHHGDAVLVRVIEVRPSSAPPPKENLEKRQETYRKAIDQSDRTNAMIFASSFSGKWGDYDPTGFESENDKDKKDKEEGPAEDSTK